MRYTRSSAYIRRKTIASRINRQRRIRSLAEAPVTTSKRACIINTKEETFSIRDEDQKASETITCQRLAVGVGVEVGRCTHTQAPSDVTGATRQNGNGPPWRGKLPQRGNFFPFVPPISPGGAASLNYPRCSFKRKCHFHVVSSAAPLIGKWERRQSTAVSLVPAKQ